MSNCKTSINFGYWNINKLVSKQVDKSKDELFISSVANNDIIGLAEVKCDTSKVYFDDFVTHFIERKTCKGNQSYGGLAILVKKGIRKGVKYLPVKCSEYQWLLLDKNFFGWDKNLYVCFAYIPPQYSTYHVEQNIDFLELIERDISSYKNKGYVLLLGDFNARTASGPDFIAHDDDNYLPLNEDYKIDNITMRRTSQDTKLCSRGRELLDLCISSRLRILNGRTFGDLTGKFTSYQYNGSSVIDYCLLSEEKMSNVLFFHVDDPILRLSDHSKISVRLMANYLLKESKECPNDFPDSFKWQSVSPQLFKDALESTEISNKLQTILGNQTNNASDVNAIVTDFRDVLIAAANVSLKKRVRKRGVKKIKPQKWFDNDLFKMRKTLDFKGKLLIKYPSDPLVRGNFFKYRKNYSKMCKSKRRKYKSEVISKLDNLFEKDPKAYWSLLDQLKENKVDSQESAIPPEEMQDHFSTLNILPEKFQERAREIETILDNSKNNFSSCKLDYLISKEEVSKCLHALKNGKSSGLDSISNEMLKYSEASLLPCILKIFNDILKLGVYPAEWKRGYINPIYKGGDKYDPSNYRGITIMSCIGKLFNSVLNSRLDNYLVENSVIDKTQIGFQKKARTSDHMFVLRTLIEKYTNGSKSRLFACFVDFKKAFDSVLHQALFLKLINIGIGGLFYKVIENMYSNNILRVKIGNGLTNDFCSNLGVRQGDTLSPNLFKVFINDLAQIFDDSCDFATLGTYKINCLMYADDVILISQTEEGLQNCLKKLEKYCELWCLDINTEKTKSVVFNKSGKLLSYSFTFNGEPIENVQSYKYLGVLFSASGTFSHAKKDLYNRGLKAFFKLKSIFSDSCPSVKTSLHIYDHTIKPILLYGCEVWGTSFSKAASLRNEPYFKLEKAFMNFECEKLSTRYYKYILGVHKRTTNIAVSGDLGRTPMFIDIICTVYKYFKRIESMDNDSLLGQTLHASKELHGSGRQTWYSDLSFILNQLNITADTTVDELKSELIRRSMEFWELQLKENAIVKNGKLRTYYHFKPFFKREIYLDTIKNVKILKCFAQFRLSAHQLAIERGRYKNVLAKDRLCKYCQANEVEDEVHFSMKCSFYKKQRENLFSMVSRSSKYFMDLSPENKFIWLMTNEDTDIIDNLASYVYECFEIRNHYVCSSNK